MFFAETYTVFCFFEGLCNVNPSPPTGEAIVLTDEIIPDVPTVVTGSTELFLSSEVSMLIAYLLRFIVFHGIGLLLCWISTMSFRRQARR